MNHHEVPRRCPNVFGGHLITINIPATKEGNHTLTL